MCTEETGRSWRRALAAAALLGIFAGCADTTLSKTKGDLVIDSSLDFGSVILGRRPTLTIHLQNTSRIAVRFGEVTFDPPVDAFTLTEPPMQTLAPGAKGSIVVAFAPAFVLPYQTQLKLPNASAKVAGWSVALAGEGVLGQVNVGPSVLNFGDIGIGTRASKEITLANQGGVSAEVVLSAPVGDDAASFDTTQAGSISVQPHRQDALTVGFAPNRMGPFLAEITALPCPTCEPQTVQLRGTGVAASFIVDPPLVEFGHLALQATRSRQVSIRNVGTRTAQLLSAQLGSSTSTAFSVAPMPANGRSLAPGETTTLDVTYAPVATSVNAGTLRIATDDSTSPVLVVGLSGGGDGPALSVSPTALNFAPTGVGLAVQRTLSIRNVGSDPSGTRPLLIQNVAVTHGVEFSVATSSATGFPLTLRPGETITATVTYTPVLAGESHGIVEIQSNDPTSNALEVPLSGSAEQLGECTYTVVPEQISFGVTPPGTRSVLAFGVHNVGPNPCAIANIRMSPASDAAFTMSGVASQLIAPGDELVVPVTFMPDEEASYTGLVQFDTSSRAAPQGRVLVSGSGARTCLTVMPGAVDFGTVGLMCQPPRRPVIARNDCVIPTDIYQAWIGTGTSDAFFSLANGQGAATTLMPGDQLQLDVTYAPNESGVHTAPLTIDSSETPTPHIVALQASAQERPTKTDTFVEGTTNKVDVLFVVDNSGSMSDKQQSLALNAANFINQALRQNADFHLGVTSMGLYPYDGGWGACPGGASGGEAGRLFPVDGSQPRIITPTTPNAAAAFASNMQVGICHWWEEGLEAARLALSAPLVDHLDSSSTPISNDGNAGFLRSDAKLYIFFVTDADDSDSTDVTSYIEMLKALKPGRPDMINVSGVLGLSTCSHIESVSSRYMQVISAFGGHVFDICASDWGATLSQVADDAFTPSSVFPLSQAPETQAITVRVEGISVASENGTQTIWHFDPTLGAAGAVVFEEGQAPRAGAQVQITYPVPCP